MGLASRLWGTEEQYKRLETEPARNGWLWGAAVNPRDNDVVVEDAGDDLMFRGHKSFSTGARVSDRLILEGVLLDDSGQPTDRRVFGVTPTDAPGLKCHANWDNMGMRLTESGSVDIDAVRVPWTDALGYTAKVLLSAGAVG
ncbi:hypothetical protein ABZU32_28875 [Sphaerisporangium sp. NPDC005288]|uniref:hypothetical protein n=1 Tax=Sphaerisporangium sp. NPDC005288 TaxID=3155114 RepID=UPI0033BFAA66